MSIAGLPLMDLLKARMQWHQARQKVLAENVANADTPGFKPRDLREPAAGRSGRGDIGMVRTSPAHLVAAGGTSGFDGRDAKRFEVSPSGNGVSLEEEMMKVAQNQTDFQMATTLYSKSLSLLKVAIGRRA
ncbi:flagellar basal body rod protein FlgB [Chelatococcus sp. SYSU_G07232]|uniref:Flagellar basal body rod protein FlgB n=1 Tax=Chelatococcus albus TaxID=3047466 RepID=A0ABT7AGF0_9HYPH|nr:flagellar basal body rod protein FlgB [Chelatococcus sp. SYSU_G07232]MDJ1158442.1 flagellar basal body rod protein FlgB [Chelatococcus sp. SYSU_G07232]